MELHSGLVSCHAGRLQTASYRGVCGSYTYACHISASGNTFCALRNRHLDMAQSRFRTQGRYHNDRCDNPHKFPLVRGLRRPFCLIYGKSCRPFRSCRAGLCSACAETALRCRRYGCCLQGRRSDNPHHKDTRSAVACSGRTCGFHRLYKSTV